MELKVLCGCGQKYKFDVEPVNGQMPFAVNCPSCGVDGTPVANQQLAEHFINNPPPPVPAPPPPAPGGLRISRPAAPASASTPPPAGETTPPPIAPLAPPPTSAPGGLRINRSAPATVAPPPADGTTPPPIAALPSNVPPPIGAPLRPGMVRAGAVDPNAPVKKPNFWMGIVGAALGALLGSAVCFLACFFLVKYAGLGWSRLVGVVGGSLLTGYLAGAGAQLLGKGEGSKELGGIAAIFVLAGVIGAQYFVAVTWWNNTVIATIDSAYGQSIKDAREALAAMPNGSDSEVRNYLFKRETDEGDDVTTNSITDAQINAFRHDELPGLQDLASGRMTKEQYDAKNGIDPAQQQKDINAAGETFKGIFLLLLIRKSTIASLIGGAALAYRITANA